MSRSDPAACTIASFFHAARCNCGENRRQRVREKTRSVSALAKDRIIADNDNAKR